MCVPKKNKRKRNTIGCERVTLQKVEENSGGFRAEGTSMSDIKTKGRQIPAMGRE